STPRPSAAVRSPGRRRAVPWREPLQRRGFGAREPSWAILDSNQGPPPYQRGPLTNWANRPATRKGSQVTTAHAAPHRPRARDAEPGDGRGSHGGEGPRNFFTAAMRIGDDIIYQGRVLVLRGMEPMSVPGRRAEVEDPATGERFVVPLEELEEAPPLGF